ncbi:MAG: nucleoside monophosphate kinase, partial [Candidatus Bathyarchaeia archaeon]
MFGPPGAGKGTYASRLHEKLGVETIATGDIFRELVKKDTELGKKVKAYVEKGLLVPDEIVTEVLKERLSQISNGRGFILDGYPRTFEQAKGL